MQLKVFFTKTALWFLVILSLLLGAFVYATIDRTVYVTDTLIVVPASVTSDSWFGVEKILINDLEEDSLYQDFRSKETF